MPRRKIWSAQMIVWAGMASLVMLCWFYLVRMSIGMSEMPHMHHMPDMVMPAATGLDALATTFLMWAVMMVGMMLPAAARRPSERLARTRRSHARTDPGAARVLHHAASIAPATTNLRAIRRSPRVPCCIERTRVDTMNVGFVSVSGGSSNHWVAVGSITARSGGTGNWHPSLRSACVVERGRLVQRET
jgi:hypothetical protein